jgi:hypothetical protein
MSSELLVFYNVGDRRNKQGVTNGISLRLLILHYLLKNEDSYR